MRIASSDSLAQLTRGGIELAIVIWFDLKKIFTSTARWIVGSVVGLVQGRWVSVTPPMFKKQILLKVETGKWLTVEIGSYYDWATIQEVFIREEYGTESFAINESIRGFYSELLGSAQKPLILDMGANIGVSSAFFSSTYPEARLVALEPSQSNFSLLCKNTLGLGNVDPLNVAIGPVSGVQKMFDPRLGNNAYRTFGADEHFVGNVNVVSVDAVLQDYPNYTPFIAKIDIEGFEGELFSKNLEWVGKFKVIAIEIHDWMLPGKAVSSNFFAAIGGKNRDLVFRGENIFSIRND
jgi:FkbM family methyltransferase